MSTQTFSAGDAVWLPAALPWVPPSYDDDTIYAIRALADGQANEGQQKRAWAYIMYVTGANDMEFRPDDKGGERASAFASGKRFVGLMLDKLLKPIMTPQAKVDPVPSRRRLDQGKRKKSR